MTGAAGCPARSGHDANAQGPPAAPSCASVLEVCFTCPFCSRIFLQDPPQAGPIPRHLDALLGTPCQGSGFPVLYHQVIGSQEAQA